MEKLSLDKSSVIIISNQDLKIKSFDTPFNETEKNKEKNLDYLTNEKNVLKNNIFEDFRRKRGKLSIEPIKKGIDQEFPILKITEQMRENPYNRLVAIFVGYLISFFIISLKNVVEKDFNIPLFCDLPVDWKIFDEKVSNKTFEMLKEDKCYDKCDFKAYIFSKIFHCDFYIVTLLSFFFFSINFKVIKKKIVIIYIWIFPIFSYLLGNIIFFRNKTNAFLVGNITIGLGVIILIIESYNLFLIFFILGIPLIFFGIVKIFFENFYFLMYKLNPSLLSLLLPFIIVIIKLLYFKVILQIKNFSRLNIITKITCSNFALIFELINLGNFHILSQNDFGNISIWINLFLNLIIDIDTKFSILKKLIFWINKNIFDKKNSKNYFYKNEFELIYIDNKIELEIFSLGLYLNLILFKFFDWSGKDLIDCFGNPLATYVQININHFVLMIVMFLNIIFKELMKKYIKNRFFLKEKDFGYNPRLMNKWEYFSYVNNLCGVAILFGYTFFYSIINTSVVRG